MPPLICARDSDIGVAICELGEAIKYYAVAVYSWRILSRNAELTKPIAGTMMVAAHSPRLLLF
jgi:hypothetical protein